MTEIQKDWSTPTEETVRHEWCVSQANKMHRDHSDWYVDIEREGVRFDRFIAKVKADALREHRRRVTRFMPPGLVNRATVLADLEDYASRYEKGVTND